MPPGTNGHTANDEGPVLSGWEDYGLSGCGVSGRAVDRFGSTLTRIPGASAAMYAMLSGSVRLRQRIGTVTVTAVGMFGDGGGFAIAAPALMPLQVVVGGIAERPVVVEGSARMRAVLDLTVTLDHNIVDGAPAARFIADLRHMIENATALDDEPSSPGR